MILSKQKCYLLLACVSTESQKRTSALQTKRAILTTRSMTRINVGLALIYVKLLRRCEVELKFTVRYSVICLQFTIHSLQFIIRAE